MIAKLKAKELVDKFVDHCDGTNDFESYEYEIAIKNSISCALICCNEIIQELTSLHEEGDDRSTGKVLEYWQKVKTHTHSL